VHPLSPAPGPRPPPPAARARSSRRMAARRWCSLWVWRLWAGLSGLLLCKCTLGSLLLRCENMEKREEGRDGGGGRGMMKALYYMHCARTNIYRLLMSILVRKGRTSARDSNICTYVR
jgi:hypothetical protein